jgi:hypothetical protein
MTYLPEDGYFHGKAVTDVHTGFERSRLQRQLENAGFSDVKFSNVYVMRKLVEGVDRAFPLFMATAHKASA